MISEAFAGDRSAINIRYNSYNPNIAWRVGMLGIAVVLLVGQSALRFVSRNQNLKGPIRPENQDIHIQAEAAHVIGQSGPHEVEVEGHQEGVSKKVFILSWWGISALEIFLPLFYVRYVSLPFAPVEWLGACFLSVYDYRSLLSIYPISGFLCLSPLIIMTTMLAVFQWQILRTRIHVSGWWIAAPVIAGLPLVFAFPGVPTCQECTRLAPSTWITGWSPDALLGWIAPVYLILVGLIQWIVLRSRLKITIVWTIIPLACGLFDVLLISLLALPFVILLMFRLLPVPFVIIVETGLIIVGAILTLAASAFSLLPALYLNRVIRKKALPAI